ncbi:heparan-alpha-glucosaminide N-acetyltransferase isoform X4 [Patella vulgata]|uniref:heparan-alpha-glucosaminide N-acetyltransferase isoform X4 n=1 Tax=Patella vulgata TaxID=6465 RepID=UPI0021802145|nr:heparan-alpha-glucosaminide N-acetyltransferase isoform X4 [Patella vulgata]
MKVSWGKMPLVIGLCLLLSCISVSYCQGYIPLCSATKDDVKMDLALLHVVNDKNKNVTLTLYVQSAECYKCNLSTGITVSPKVNCSLLVDTRWPTRLAIEPEDGTSSHSCREDMLSMSFVEGGIYNIFITISGIANNVNCSSPQLINDPPDVNIPIYVAIGVGVGASLIWIVLKDLYNRGTFHRLLCCWSTEGMMVDLGSPTNINATDDSSSSVTANKDDKKVKKERLKSLDSFRGIAIVIMIFVNYRGGDYWFFKHSKWNGLTVADIVFPWFVFIMGTAMAYSFSAQLRKGMSKKFMLLKVIKRSMILFLLGLLVNSSGYNEGVKLELFRIPGVLQRFAGTYLITAGIHIFFARSSDASRDSWWSSIRDILYYWPEWIINLTFIITHLAITFYLKVPDCPTGYLGPGGASEEGKHYNCTGGAAGYIDRMVFGDAHIYQNPTCKEIYNTVIPYDPEGLLGTLNSCFMCFLGLQAGKILLIHKDWVLRIKRLLIWGIVTGTIATILCKASKNDGWIPINKNLWSLSFVLALAGMAYILLMLCYLLIDVYPVWSGSPFYYPGMNSIFIYICHMVFENYFPVGVWVMPQHDQHLLLDIWGPIFWCLVAYKMHSMKLYINI